MARKARKSEKLLLSSVFLLTIFGLVVLASISIPLSQENFGESYFYFKHQLIYGFLVGLILFFIARNLSPNVYKKLALPFFIVSVILLGLVFLPSLGVAAGGAKRWLSVFGFSFQPAELAKIATVIYLAAWLNKRHHKVRKFSSFFSFLVIVGIVGGLIALQPDIGTAVLIGAVGLTLYFSAGAKLKSILLILLISGLACGALIAIKPYRMERILSFINPSEDIQGKSYQINQALITIGSGGFFGKGLGHSIQKYQYLPEPMGDSIFAIIGEELGFLGTSILLFLFAVFILSGFKIAARSRTRFGTLLVIGLVAWIGIQAFINIGVIIGLMPFTGIPLPFISYGGTALALELAAVGIISSVARH